LAYGGIARLKPKLTFASVWHIYVVDMQLTLNQVLFIILTVAAVVAVVFLVRFLIQLRRTAREGEKALAKAQELMDGLREIEGKINASLEDVGQVLQTSKKVAAGVTEITGLLATRVIRSSAKYWPFILPLVSFGWQRLKKRKEKKDGG
jgi:multidrug transporter EmrE-like cation transporter